jgi:hypothetical protein
MKRLNHEGADREFCVYVLKKTEFEFGGSHVS